MEFDEDQQAAAIAAEWGVDVELLEQARWTLETIDGAEGEPYGYIVRFDDDETPPEVLAQLGLRFGQMERPLSINAFDEFEEGGYGSAQYGHGRYGGVSKDDVDDGIYSVDDPLPDISDFIDDSEDEEQSKNPRLSEFHLDRDAQLVPDGIGATNGAALNELDVNGPTYVGASFAGSSYVSGPAAKTGQIELLLSEMLGRLDNLESVIRRSANIAPNRGHNHPPELLDVEPTITQKQSLEIVESVAAIRVESQSGSPNLERVITAAETFRKIVKLLGVAVLATTGFVAQEVVSLEIGIAHAQHRQEVITALTEAYDSVIVWAQTIANTL